MPSHPLVCRGGRGMGAQREWGIRGVGGYRGWADGGGWATTGGWEGRPINCKTFITSKWPPQRHPTISGLWARPTLLSFRLFFRMGNGVYITYVVKRISEVLFSPNFIVVKSAKKDVVKLIHTNLLI